MYSYKICHKCGGKMPKHVNEVSFRKNGRFYNIPNVTFFQCENCGEKIFEAAEAKRIDTLLKNPEDVLSSN